MAENSQSVRIYNGTRTIIKHKLAIETPTNVLQHANDDDCNPGIDVFYTNAEIM